MPRLKTTYEKEIVSKLMGKLSLKNKHEVPKIKKIIFVYFFLFSPPENLVC